MTYAERLAQSQDELSQSQIEGKVIETRSRIEAKIATKRAQVANLRNNLGGLLSQYPLDIEMYLLGNDDVTKVEQEIAKLEGVIAELF